MIPSVGRVVHYTLAEGDLPAANYKEPGQHSNSHAEGDVIPFLICRVWSNEPTETTCVNGQGFVDGNFSVWLTSRQQGVGPGKWSDPRG